MQSNFKSEIESKQRSSLKHNSDSARVNEIDRRTEFQSGKLNYLCLIYRLIANHQKKNRLICDSGNKKCKASLRFNSILPTGLDFSFDVRSKLSLHSSSITNLFKSIRMFISYD